MVIAHVLSSFFVGGQEVLAVELATRQAARGHRVLAISLAPTVAGTLSEAFERAGVKTLHIPKRGPTIDVSLPVRLALAFRGNAVDVAHLHNQMPLIYGAPAGNLVGCAVVATRHGLIEDAGRQPWLRGHAIRLVAHLVHGFVAVSTEVAESTRASGVATEPKLVVIENGIDLGQYQARPDVRAAVRAELGLSADALAIGTVCRLVECKNVGLLLRTAIPHLSPARQLFIVGDGPERGALESLASSHPQGRFVRFLGQRPDVDRLLTALDLFALSSSTEGHPISVIEAMASGLPVLSTKVGGIPEMIEDGTTGFLAPVDEPAFAARLATALDQWRGWPEMGRAARAAASERFSSETMTDRYLALYEKIMRSRQLPLQSGGKWKR
jgi:glycosyltransferase involved in cell wall biosynthesis